MTYNTYAENNPPYTIDEVMTDESLEFMEGIVMSPTVQRDIATRFGRPDYVPYFYRKDKTDVSGD